MVLQASEGRHFLVPETHDAPDGRQESTVLLHMLFTALGFGKKLICQWYCSTGFQALCSEAFVYSICRESQHTVKVPVYCKSRKRGIEGV